MTHRIYVRCAGQKVIYKTTTESPAVAAFAFGELEGMVDLGSDAVGIAWSEDGKQVRYIDLSVVDSPLPSPGPKGG